MCALMRVCVCVLACWRLAKGNLSEPSASFGQDNEVDTDSPAVPARLAV